ncbi:carboxypeptidase-like regulatory domain-containing protein [Paraflavitalea sp. CAU 1676]|uniref:carboxypeptidase-like regulatory domain-containing protein n=1 Tax=Paraflavitalea sp. CAU 1676 TaxID=3032598 RepID=UPI0023DC44F0|nr:carboxypeptidase-like regulatory domain-containing protein [Paraflavitalea sp. CAU 1676]MDF2187808.1 carboxypeptidase-like regulatory domain-containing protein [Paraflavitalea sp. CAU 1676]
MNTGTRLTLIALLGASSITLQCKRDASIDDLTTTLMTGSSASTIIGKVTDEYGMPVQDAIVSNAGVKVLTDANGRFTLSMTAVEEDRRFIRADHSGYFPGLRTCQASRQDTQYVRLSLLSKKIAGSFHALNGGLVSIGKKGQVDFSPNSIVNASDNSSYTGQVQVAIAYIDPAAKNFQETMPGELGGLTTGSRAVGLQSFGMLAVELTGHEGQQLQIAPGKQATVKIGIPTQLQKQSPATIPLWHFDEAAGIWKEEGFAIRTGAQYTGKVSHFSFWNADYPYPAVRLQASLLVKGAKFPIPIANYKVVIKAANDPVSTYGYGYTDAWGVVAGMVPANRDLEIYLHDYCGNAYLVAKVKGGDSDIQLGDIYVKNWLGMREDPSGQPVDCID